MENYQRVYPNPPKFSGWSSFPCWNVHFLDKARSPPLAIGFWPKYSWVTYPICKWLQRMAMKIANVWVKHCYIAEYLPQVHHFSRQNSQTVHVNDEDSSRLKKKGFLSPVTHSPRTPSFPHSNSPSPSRALAATFSRKLRQGVEKLDPSPRKKGIKSSENGGRTENFYRILAGGLSSSVWKCRIWEATCHS